MSSFCTTTLKCSRKVKDVMHAEVGMESHGSVIIPLQIKEKFFENPSLILQNSDLISVFTATCISCDLLQAFYQHTSNKLHLTSSG